MITEETIAEILSMPLSLDERAEKLIEAANTAGGSDNVTVALCLVEEITEDASS